MQAIRPLGIALGKKLQGWAGDRSLRDTAFVFVLTRLVVLVIFLFAGSARLDPRAPNYNPRDPHPVAHFQTGEVKKLLTHVLTRGDSAWYVAIAKSGYERRAFDAREQHNWAFFPLYPLLVRGGAFLTGEYWITGALLSDALLFVALLLLHKLVTTLGYDAFTAQRTIFYSATFPASYFFSLPVTESLFFCLVVASFLAAARRHWWAAGLLGGLASATRISGILLLPALGLFYWQRREGRWRWNILWLALVPVGLAAFSLFLWNITGNPLAHIDAVAAWNRKSGFFLTTLYDYLREPFEIIAPWDFRALNFCAAILALGGVVYWVRLKQWAFALYSFLAILLPLSSGLLQSTARYVSVIFPLFIALGLAGRRPWLDQTIRVLFLVFFALMTLSYALRWSFAAA